AAGADPEAVYRLLDSAAPDDLDGVRRIGEEVRALLLAVPIPSQVAAAAGDAWRELGADGAYAVRSSATAEDLPGASFAGQQDTYLNVIGEVALLDAIRRCWVSLFTDRAILYRCRNGFSHRDVQLSVVVQQMIMAEVSGILFTADPVTGHRHTLAIDASFGLGEALVGGLVSPDSYRVDKGSRAIIEGHVADKGVAVYPVKEGGSRQVALPPEKRTQAVLTDGQILELADVGCRVEAHYGAPQDIEWAMADGHLYLLQARPITSLYPIDGLTSPDGSLHVYFSMGHQQNMTRAMSPLSLSSLQTLVPVGHGRGPFENDYVRVGGGRLFADLTVVLRHPVFRRAAFGAVAQFDALGPDMLNAAMGRREFQGARRLLPPLAVVKAGASFLQRVQSALWRQDLTGVVDETNGLIDRFIADVANSLRDKPAGREGCQAMVDAMAGLFPFFMNWVPQFVAGEAAKRLIVRLGRRWASAADLDALTLGLPGNVVTEMNLALGDLADLARQSPALVE
ncbi:MAG: PEP/pyruvate-binding domain-containing protein, partial [Anaerolineae bacterium]